MLVFIQGGSKNSFVKVGSDVVENYNFQYLNVLFPLADADPFQSILQLLCVLLFAPIPTVVHCTYTNSFQDVDPLEV